MKFSIEKDVLNKSLEDVVRAIDSNNIYVHLRNFYIDVLDNLIVIKGSNGYFSIESKIESKNIISVEKIGTFLIPANIFLNVIKRCSGKIEIFSKENVLYINNQKDKYEINLLNPEDYPSIDFSLYGNKIMVNVEKLRKAINNVIFATSQQNDEIILSGVNIKYSNNELLITATDSFRLAREIIKINDDRKIDFDVTIVNKNIKNFIPIDAKGEVAFYVNEHKINMIIGTTNYQSKIIDAPYKNVSKLFDVEFDKKLIIEKNIFSNAINKATVLSSESSYNRIIIKINNEEISLSTQTEEIGRSSVIIDNDKYQYNGEDIRIVLNYKFLKEAISVFNDKIYINLTKSTGLILISDENNENKQIISPMIS